MEFEKLQLDLDKRIEEIKQELIKNKIQLSAQYILIVTEIEIRKKN